MLARIQNDLFDLGADLCRPGDVADGKALRVGETQVERLEKEIDALNAELRPLDSFVLPGGSPAAAYLHLARTITRRSERLVCELAETRGRQFCSHSLFESSIGPSLRTVAVGQRQRCCGRALDARSQSLIPAQLRQLTTA